MVCLQKKAQGTRRIRESAQAGDRYVFCVRRKELAYLRRKDKRLCEVIDRIGHIDRAVDTDLFSSVVHHIIGQQISTKAQATIWQRMQDALGQVNAETILAAGVPGCRLWA